MTQSEQGLTDYRFIKSQELVGEGFNDLPLFYQPRFMLRKQPFDVHCFQLLLDNRPAAVICFQISNAAAVSLINSPFGGLVIMTRGSQELMVKFMSYVVDQLAQLGVNSIIIKTPPKVYMESAVSNTDSIYQSAGFNVQYNEVNQYLTPTNSMPFEKLVARNRRSHLNQATGQNFVFKKLNTSYLLQAYRLVEQCHQEKGFPVTMSYDALEKMFVDFPDEYWLFGLFYENELIACSVSILVSADVLYNFYHGDGLHYRKFSPLTSLLNGIYNFCLHEKISLLDLGISSENGELNQGLFNFKKSLGAEPGDKVIYELKL